MRKILIVGAGYAGFYTAWKLEKKLRRGEAQVTVIDPRPYMTYQPFLPEVMAGSIEPRHAVVSLRSHLRRTEVIAGTVTAIDHANKIVTVRSATGSEFEFSYDVIVVTAGAVTRTFPIAGVAEQGIGLKHIEEAIAVRNRLLAAFDQASNLPAVRAKASAHSHVRRWWVRRCGGVRRAFVLSDGAAWVLSQARVQ